MVGGDGIRRASGNCSGSPSQDHCDRPLWTDARGRPYGQGESTGTSSIAVGRYPGGGGAETVSGTVPLSAALPGQPTRTGYGRPTFVLAGRSRSVLLPGGPLGIATKGLATAVPDRLRSDRP